MTGTIPVGVIFVSADEWDQLWYDALANKGEHTSVESLRRLFAVKYRVVESEIRPLYHVGAGAPEAGL